MEQTAKMYEDLASVMLTKEQLKNRVCELGKQITEDYKDRPLLVICILKGSCVFFADLIREIALPIETEFMAVSSYGAGTETSGNVCILKDIGKDIEGMNVLVVEDIIDSGMTLYKLKGILESRNAASVKIATLLDKPARRKVDLSPDYSGFVIEDAFVVGYGLDYAEKYRNLPDIGILSPRIYEA